MRPTPVRPVVTALLVAVGATVAVGVLILAIGIRAEWVWQIFATGGTLVLALGIFTAAVAVMGRGRLRILMIMAVAVAGLAAAIMLAVVWELPATSSDREDCMILAIAMFLAGGALAHNGVLTLVRAHSRLVRGIRASTIACSWLLVADFASLFWFEVAGGSNWGLLLTLAIVGGVLIVAVAVGTLAVPVAAVSHADRRQAPIESIGSRLSVRLECPRCGQRQTLRTGAVRCASCRAGLVIEIDEPRCECGYLLYQLVGDRCPECGREIPEALRWSAAADPGAVTPGPAS